MIQSWHPYAFPLTRKKSKLNNMKTNERSLSRRKLLKSILTTAPVAMIAATPNQAQASPSGARPTVMSSVSITSVNSGTMRVAGRLTTLDGRPLAGMPVEVYAVGPAYFSRWYTLHTDGNGYFGENMSKPGIGAKLQIEIQGNGAYNRPLPTFNRP